MQIRPMIRGPVMSQPRIGMVSLMVAKLESASKNSAVISRPMKPPYTASTLDHANQYPNTAIGPASEKYRRQPSRAYTDRPPGLSGNMAAGSA